MPLSFDAIVNGLVAQGVRRDRAEAIARRELKLGTVESLAVVEADETAREKEEQAAVMKLFRAFGFIVRSTSQPRASKVAAGLPDLIVMHPAIGVAFFFETKRPVGGKLSPAQLEFRTDCQRCGWEYVSGDRRAAQQKLIALGLARVEGDTIEPIRGDAQAVAV